jgi:GT2 family glycosyltransferase
VSQLIIASQPAADSASASAPDVIVAIPVHDECERIEPCLRALAAQLGLRSHRLGVLLFLNNCTDGTNERVAAIAPSVPWPLRVIDIVHVGATAGWARREAMEAAARWLDEGAAPGGGVLMTTDADSRVGPDWVLRNLACLEAGADGVAGRISLDPDDAALLPPSLHARGRLEGEYEALLTEIGARLDPEPLNAWPTHWTRSGATLAVRRHAYERVGGMPARAHGEDRAFVDALRAAGFAVRHAPEIVVVTSGRLEGRAPGGAAETMKRRCEIPDDPCDDRLEPLARAVMRVLWRRWLRRLHAARLLRQRWLWAPLLRIDGSRAATIATLASFSQVHASIEDGSPNLTYRPLRPSQLPGQIRMATLLLAVLRWLTRDRSHPICSGAGQAGIAPSDPDAAPV